MNLYPVSLLCYYWSTAVIGLDYGMRTHSFRPSALRSSKESITHPQPPPQSCCASKASLFFFSAESAESAAGCIKMLREASSLFLILCPQLIFSSQNLGRRIALPCYRCHIVLCRLGSGKYILLTQKCGRLLSVHTIKNLCMATFDTEAHFLLFSTCAYCLLAVRYVDSIPSLLQRPDEFHLLPIILPRFSPCAPPTRHLFPSLSTHMNAIS